MSHNGYSQLYRDYTGSWGSGGGDKVPLGLGRWPEDHTPTRVPPPPPHRPGVAEKRGAESERPLVEFTHPLQTSPRNTWKPLPYPHRKNRGPQLGNNPRKYSKTLENTRTNLDAVRDSFWCFLFAREVYAWQECGG